MSVEDMQISSQDKSDGQKGGGGGMFKGLVDTIIGNLQLSISNIHVRYEVSPQRSLTR